MSLISKPEFRKFRLKEWMGMQAHLSTIHAAAKTHSPDVPDLICRFLAAATDSSEDYWKSIPWLQVMEGFDQLSNVNMPSWTVPMLSVMRGGKPRNEPWLYIGGEWYYWLHVFAETYDWQEEYIAELEIEKAFALMQEILVEKQLHQEWEYMMSDESVTSDDKGKTYHIRTLPRPDWMVPDIPKPRPTKVPKGMLPIGVVSVMDPSMKDMLDLANGVETTKPN
jgi:hypothetical protein